jgi:hypothetical protein
VLKIFFMFLLYFSNRPECDSSTCSELILGRGGVGVGWGLQEVH